MPNDNGTPANTDRTFDHESVQDPETVRSYLAALMDGFAKGVLRFSDGDGEITLEPRALIDFRVQASRKRDRVRLTLHFSWKELDETDREDILHINGASQ